MQICLQRSVSRIAKTASKLKGVDPPAILSPVLSARVSPPALYPCAQQARAAQNESLVDPSKPIEGSLLEKPEEPGPEDCCQVCKSIALLGSFLVDFQPSWTRSK